VLTIRKDLNLTDNEIEIPINWGGVDMTIFLPGSYLTTEFNKDISSYGAIVYNNYPLLPNNTQNISSNIISVRLFDDLKNSLNISNLQTPIKILIKKTKPDMKYCVFMDTKNM